MFFDIEWFVVDTNDKKSHLPKLLPARWATAAVRALFHKVFGDGSPTSKKFLFDAEVYHFGHRNQAEFKSRCDQ